MIRGGFSPLFHYLQVMNKTEIENAVNSYLEDKMIFLVEVEVRKGNIIDVFIDSDNGVSIEECVEVSRMIESEFNRNEEDYELRVSSPGLGRPLKMLRQYNRYIGHDIEVQTTDNRKITGELTAFSDTEIEILVKSGKKGIDLKSEKLSFSEIRKTLPLIAFKSRKDIN